MKLRFKKLHVTISDDSPEAKKILQGYDYSFNGERVVVHPEKIHYDIDAFSSKVIRSKETKEDIHEFMVELISIYKKIKYNID